MPNYPEVTEYTSYTGETYPDSSDTDGYNKFGPDKNQIAAIYSKEGWESSLYAMHARERIPFPYDLVCLGDSGDQQRGFESYLELDEGKSAICSLLKFEGVTRAKVAEHMGVTISTVGAWACGRRKCPAKILEVLEEMRP